jgi:hypothetical protein
MTVSFVVGFCEELLHAKSRVTAMVNTITDPTTQGLYLTSCLLIFWEWQNKDVLEIRPYGQYFFSNRNLRDR